MYSNSDKNKNKLIKSKVTFTNIETNIIDDTVEIGEGSKIGPFVILQDQVKIGKNVEIDAGVIIKNHVEIGDNVRILAYVNLIDNVKIHNDVFIGQYSILRDHVNVGSQTSVGPTCEIARSIIGCHCAFGHRNYISDATICDNVQFGLGASILNSNWKKTFKTFIHKDVKVGGNVSLIAPIIIGENVTIGAGSIITNDIPENSLCVARAEMDIKLKTK